jgi:RND family efflux transporter MFP subunit
MTKLILTLLLLFAGLVYAGEENAPVPITVKPLSSLQIDPVYSAPATVISLNHSQLSAQISARIESIDVLVGERIQPGDTLVQLDCSDSELAKQNALARQKLARKELKRAKSLRRSNSIPEQDFNKVETELTQAFIAIEQARLKVQRCNITAPFAGIVTRRQASEGELAIPGTALLRLLDNQRLEVSAQAPVEQTGTIATAKTLTFKTGAKQYSLKLRAISPHINSHARNQEVRLVFTEQKALPGAAGRLLWQTGVPHIPVDILVQRNQQTGVFIFQKDSAHFVALADAKMGHPAPAEFLPNDTPIIIDGRFGLTEGDSVSVINQ